MEHLNSIRAALRGAAPVVAIPVPGHAPVCIRAKLLKGALKGVTIDSVEITETRWLRIKRPCWKRPHILLFRSYRLAMTR